jgi:hypothetical protein
MSPSETECSRSREWGSLRRAIAGDDDLFLSHSALKYEKLFLGAPFPAQLNIVHQQNINIAIFLTELMAVVAMAWTSYSRTVRKTYSSSECLFRC